MSNKKILLTGATGYVGGRLLKALEMAGHTVRCLVRRPENLIDRVAVTTEVVEGDVLDRDVLREAMRGIEVAYYLIHSMGSTRDFEIQDRLSAAVFGDVARETGVQRIVYLGGLGEAVSLSSHLSSRQEVGAILKDSGVQTLEFRASIVIGSGSVSFELIRGLVRNVPVMITPRWVRTPAQPIAIEDVIEYLVAALGYEHSDSRVFEIGGADQVSYGELMMEYARQRGLKRVMLPVPLLSLRLSSLWLGLVTPVYARIGRKMIEGVRNETTVKDDSARQVFDVVPRGYKEAIARALSNEDREVAQTRWSDALSSSGYEKRFGGIRTHNRIVDSRSASVHVGPDSAFDPIQKIGGDTGWYYANWLWKIRGFLDLLVGGVGVRRGRRDPVELQVGDVLDFWRVAGFEPGRKLLLEAEMKLPGRAWLSFEADQVEGGGTTVTQTAIFDPAGLSGLLYWYALYPAHRFVFAGMLKGIVRAIEQPLTESGVWSAVRCSTSRNSPNRTRSRVSSSELTIQL